MSDLILASDSTGSLYPDDSGLYKSYLEFRQTQHLYSSAVKSLRLKLETINGEFFASYSSSPIHHIESRIKSGHSIVEKLSKKGLEISAESAKNNLNDIGAIRVVCNYIDDVYRVEEMLLRQGDIELVKRQDYIKEPNFNGYRSLHLDVRVPVFLSDTTEYVMVEIQIRSVAMDFWASLEHDLRYKADKSSIPAGIDEEMLRISDEIAKIDERMQSMHKRLTERI